MPYIKENEKTKWLNSLLLLPQMKGLAKGEFTYFFYKIAKIYLGQVGRSYTNISTILSCLDDAKEELRRQEMNPYEDIKKATNGDVV